MQAMQVIRWIFVGAFLVQTIWAKPEKDVKMRFRGGPDVLTMDEFRNFIFNKTYIGVYEILVPGARPSIYGLEQTITTSDINSTWFNRRCLFDTNPFTPTYTCREVIATMENLVVDKAIFVLKPLPTQTGPERIEVIFSSRPADYTLSALCFKYSGLPNGNFVKCPKTDTMIVLKVLAKDQPLNQLHLKSIVQDMKTNTNVQFGGQDDDLQTLFLAGYKNTCD